MQKLILSHSESGSEEFMSASGEESEARASLDSEDNMLAVEFAADDLSEKTQSENPSAQKSAAASVGESFRENINDYSQEELYELGRKLTLKQARALALKRSNTLKAGLNRITSATYGEKISAASFWPRVDFSASHQDFRKVATNSLSFGTTSPYTQSRYGVSADYTVYDGSRRRHMLEIAKEQKQQSSLSLKESKRMILKEVTSRYFQGVFLRRRIEQLEGDLEYEKSNLVIAQDRFKAGLANHTEMKNFELRVKRVESQALDLQLEWDILISELAALFNVARENLAGLEELEFRPSPESLKIQNMKHYIDLAREQRVDFLISRSQLREINKRAELAQTAYAPTLSVFANGYNTSRNGFKADDEGTSYSFGVQLNYNLFNGLSDRNSILRDQALVRAQSLEVDNSDLLIRTEVESHYLQAQKWLRNMQLEKETLVLARDKREDAQKEYLGGVSGILRVNEAQNEFSQSETSFIVAEVQVAQALELLDIACGDLEL
ncbi:MAG: TolC family protein [Planctomycetes bacterium]|nr:TolC family protein [Planctomycetota bacterium]